MSSCFVAAPEFRLIREHTRYRRDLTGERTREKQRAEKLLESAAVKISSVLTDVHGVTGRDIMGRLIAGERDPRTLAELARGTARKKIPQLREALEGAEFFTPEHGALLGVMLARIDRIDADIAALTAVIERLLAPYEEQLQQAESMPGWGRRAAQDVIAETGVDMTRFATPGHLASWAAGLRSTGSPASAPPRPPQARQPLHRRGHRRDLRRGRQDPDPRGARYRRLSRKRGKAKANVALGNTQMRVLHVLLSNPGTRYTDLGPDYYDHDRNTARQVSHHVGKLGALGYEVTLCRRPEPDGTGGTQAA